MATAAGDPMVPRVFRSTQMLMEIQLMEGQLHMEGAHHTAEVQEEDQLEDPVMGSGGMASMSRGPQTLASNANFSACRMILPSSTLVLTLLTTTISRSKLPGMMSLSQ